MSIISFYRARRPSIYSSFLSLGNLGSIRSWLTRAVRLKRLSKLRHSILRHQFSLTRWEPAWRPNADSLSISGAANARVSAYDIARSRFSAHPPRPRPWSQSPLFESSAPALFESFEHFRRSFKEDLFAFKRDARNAPKDEERDSTRKSLVSFVWRHSRNSPESGEVYGEATV